jgi:hypothetical protein
MRLPRFRLTTRRLMFLTAVLAMLLGWGTRPYPAFVFGSAGWYVTWSDGSNSMAAGPNTLKFRGNSWFLVVDWPDGSTSYYLTLRDNPFW